LLLPAPIDLSSSKLFEEGAIEPMDEGSQLVALALGAQPKEVVLDACAGAGGKTLALAAAMQGTGRLVALDPDAQKLRELEKRARRARITSCEAIEGELEALPKKMIGAFDRVLVDAPCTGSGTLRRHPDLAWRMSERELDAHVARQKRLIACAIGAAK